MARRRDNRWTIRITEWIPHGNKRPRGRPRTRWCDDLIQYVGPTWSHIARDRKLWQACREGFLLRERETPWVMMMMMKLHYFTYLSHMATFQLILPYVCYFTYLSHMAHPCSPTAVWLSVWFHNFEIKREDFRLSELNPETLTDINTLVTISHRPFALPQLPIRYFTHMLS